MVVFKMNRKNAFVKEFKDVAFSLQEGDFSSFETDFGFHIIYVEKLKVKN
jgi:peptidyl-prolyl cis-trans isomerase SurA